MTRSATSWLARKAPDCHSMASTSVVLPWSTWATIATLRRSSRVESMAGVSAAAAARARAPAPGGRPVMSRRGLRGESGTPELGVQGQVVGDLLDVARLVVQHEGDAGAGGAGAARAPDAVHVVVVVAGGVER